jgi:hypothetical protein
LDPENLDSEVSSTISVTYNTSLTYNNHVKITCLMPDTTYYYMPTSLMESDNANGPYSFKTSRPAGDGAPYSIAVVEMGTFRPEGLGTTAGAGVPPNNILKPGETNTIQSITSALDDMISCYIVGFSSLFITTYTDLLTSWSYCLRRHMDQRGKNWIY